MLMLSFERGGEHISGSVYMFLFLGGSRFDCVFLHIIPVYPFFSEDIEMENKSDLGLPGLFRLTAQVEHGAAETAHSDGVSHSNAGCVQ